MTSPLVAVAMAALQPYDVRLDEADGRIVIRRGTVDFEAALAVTGLSRNVMLAMLGARRAHIDTGQKPRPHHIAAPIPTHDAGAESIWDRLSLNLWALRMGLFHDRSAGWVPLIGYSGLALYMGVEEQTVRRWAIANTDFPTSACEVDTEAFLNHPLFPVYEARRFGLGQRRVDPRTDAEQVPQLVVAEALRRASEAIRASHAVRG